MSTSSPDVGWGEIMRSVTVDWARWQSSLDVPLRRAPHPTLGRGLPRGWRLRARIVGMDPDAPNVEMFLLRRDRGGWLVLSWDAAGGTSIHYLGGTLADLLAELAADAAMSGAVTDRNILGWLRRVITGLYDRSDPVEAAAAVLFALGGPLWVEPATATD